MTKVADEVLAYCSQCKMDLLATVVAMKGDQLVRVHCKTCKKERAYKAPKGVNEPGQVPAAAKPRKARGAARNEAGEKIDQSVEAEWRKIMASHAAVKAQSYSTKGSFSVGDKLAHPTFGEGIIMKHLHPNKIEVIFETDIKILLSGAPKPAH